MSFKHVTAEHLGSIETEVDVAAYNAALDYLSDDEPDADEWLWNNGDFTQRLRSCCEAMRDADADSPHVDQAMRDAAVAWLEQEAVA